MVNDMNAALRAQEWQKLKKEEEWIASFIESLDSMIRRDMEAYKVKRAEWVKRKEECQKKMKELEG